MAFRYRRSAEHRRSIECLTAENERLRAQNEALRQQSDGTLSPPGAGKQFRELPSEVRNMIWKLAAGPRLKTIFEIKERDHYHPRRWPCRQYQEPVNYGMFVSDNVFRRRVKISQVCSEARSLLAPTFTEPADVAAKCPGDPTPPGEGGTYDFAIWIWFDPALDALQLPSVRSYIKELEVCRLVRGPVPRVLLPTCCALKLSDIPTSATIRPFYNLNGCESIGFIGRSVMLSPEHQVQDLLAAKLGGGIPLAIDLDDDVANTALQEIFARYPPKSSWKHTRRTHQHLHESPWGWSGYHKFGPRSLQVNNGLGGSGFELTTLLRDKVARQLWGSRSDRLQAGPFPGVGDPWCQEHKLLREFPALKPIVLFVEHDPPQVHLGKRRRTDSKSTETTT